MYATIALDKPRCEQTKTPTVSNWSWLHGDLQGIPCIRCSSRMARELTEADVLYAVGISKLIKGYCLECMSDIILNGEVRPYDLHTL